jgi:hypothetical protein
MRLDSMFTVKRNESAECTVQVHTESVEASSSTCEVPCSRNADSAARSHQQQQPSAHERVKVETTFVADSMATDSCRFADSETNLFDDLPVRRRTNRNAEQSVGNTSATNEMKGELVVPSPESAAQSRNSQLSSYSSSLQEMPTLLVRKTVTETPSSSSVNKQGTVRSVSCAGHICLVICLP